MTEEAALARAAAPDSAPDSARLKSELLDRDVLRETSVAGVYQRSWTFESVVRGLETVAHRSGEQVGGGFGEPQLLPAGDPAPATWRTPTTWSRSPTWSARCTPSGAATPSTPSCSLGPRRAATGQGCCDPSDLMMSSAACHALYPTLPRRLPPDGHRAELQGFCFRHEPSSRVTRMQSFRMHELVRIGTPDEALAHRDTMLQAALEALTALGLTVWDVPANDPFFGRAGRLLARNQRVEELKYEIVCEVDSSEPTAIASANLHRDHFGEQFGIHTSDGETAHSACFAFGLERIALALFATYGPLTSDWPDDVRAQLGIDHAGPG